MGNAKPKDRISFTITLSQRILHFAQSHPKQGNTEQQYRKCTEMADADFLGIVFLPRKFGVSREAQTNRTQATESNKPDLFSESGFRESIVFLRANPCGASSRASGTSGRQRIGSD